jgi:hypothetical protein
MTRERGPTIPPDGVLTDTRIEQRPHANRRQASSCRRAVAILVERRVEVASRTYRASHRRLHEQRRTRPTAQLDDHGDAGRP